MRTAMAAGAGGVLAAFLGSLCCMGPPFAALGVGAGLGGILAPLRLVSAVLMLGLLGIAFYSTYGPRRRPGMPKPGGADARPADSSLAPPTSDSCAGPCDRRGKRVMLWLAAFLALVFWMLPTWSRLLI